MECNDRPLEVLRIQDVLLMTKLSRSTLWRLRRAGKFPTPFTLIPGHSAWLRRDVERWIRSRAAQ